MPYLSTEERCKELKSLIGKNTLLNIQPSSAECFKMADEATVSNSDGLADATSCVCQPWKRKHQHTEKDHSLSDDGLKKARYTWQVKGQRLKSHESDRNEDPVTLTTSGGNKFTSSCSEENENMICAKQSKPCSSISSHHVGNPEHITGCRMEAERRLSADCYDGIQTDSEKRGDKSTRFSGENLLDGVTHRREISYTNEQLSSVFATDVRFPSSASGTGVLNIEDGDHVQHGRRADSLKRWRALNTAGAVVDNVLNKTLEEMGLSPNQLENVILPSQSGVENLSIIQAIEQQGLVLTSRYGTLLHNEAGTISPDVRDELLHAAFTGLPKSQDEPTASMRALDSSSKFSQSSSCSRQSNSTDVWCNNPENQPPGTSNIIQRESSNVLDLAVFTAIHTTGLSVRQEDPHL